MGKVFINADQAKMMYDDGKAVFVDCRHKLTDPDFGQKAYQKEHLPNARFAHLDKDLSGKISSKSGRHPFPKITSFIEYLEDHAITPDKKIISYDNFNGAISARLWFMLTQIGYPEVSIMSESIETWKEMGFPTSSEKVTSTRKNVEISISDWKQGPYRIADIEEIESIEHLIDSRAPERYRGEEEPYDKIAGRIPGAVNLYWKDHLDDAGNLHDKDVLRQKFASVGHSEETVYYCGSGVSANFNLALAEELDLPSSGLYPGSYSEWSRNGKEVETG